MSDVQNIPDLIEGVSRLLKEKLGAPGATLDSALRKARRRLPRAIYGKAALLAEAEPLAGHPKLRLTLDADSLGKAAAEVTRHLEEIDLADRRKGWWLGMAGGMVFNLLLFAVILISGLRILGFV